MKALKTQFLLLFICTFSYVSSQNLLDLSTWTVGTGSTTGFAQYGATAENNRILGDNHVESQTVLWEAVPDNGGAQSGGFGSSYITIDNTKDYRLSVWIKKTNSNDGYTYFKCTSYINGSTHLLDLNGASVDYPQFWYGDLPVLDRWYLLVGFVHNSNYTSTINLGRIYDGVTGEEVQTILDYKFKSTATKLQHRAFLYGDTNTSDRQYMYEPRIELVDGNESSINDLLKVNENSELILSYDASGNQTQRFYCDIGSCSIPTPPSETNTEDDIIVEKDDDILQNSLNVFPNPTKGKISVLLDSNSDIDFIKSIKVYSSNGVMIKNMQLQEKQEEIDLSNYSSGVYFIHLHFDNDTSITKKIIKN